MRSRTSSPRPAGTTAYLLAILFAAVGLAQPTKAETETAGSQLARFEPFLGKTWRALVDPEGDVYDVARWERALAGQAVRIVHSVGDGTYGGETFVMWDRSIEELVYYYFTTAGFYTHGTMRFDDAGHLVSTETVEGHEGGVTQVQATQHVLPDGRMSVRTRMLRNGVWEDRGEVTYSVDPTAQVILPNESGPGVE